MVVEVRLDLGEMTDREEAKKLKEYLSENFPLTQQIKIIAQHLKIFTIYHCILFYFIFQYSCDCYAYRTSFEVEVL